MKICEVQTVDGCIMANSFLKKGWVLLFPPTVHGKETYYTLGCVENELSETVDIPEKLDLLKIIREQIWILSEWNKIHINKEPEQVRKNVETILAVKKNLDYSEYFISSDREVCEETKDEKKPT